MANGEVELKVTLIPNEILLEVVAERARQERLKAEGRFRFSCADVEMSNGERLAVLGEEFGEVARAFLETQRLANDRHNKDLRAELIQVAAVAVAWVEGLDAKARMIVAFRETRA